MVSRNPLSGSDRPSREMSPFNADRVAHALASEITETLTETRWHYTGSFTGALHVCVCITHVLRYELDYQSQIDNPYAA